MGAPVDAGAVGVWYAAAFLPSADSDRWLLRISMTAAVEGGQREDSYARDIEEACQLLRDWYTLVTSDH